MVTAVADTAHRGPHEEDWPLRAWALALLGALVALAIYEILQTDAPHRWSEDASRLSLATLLSTAGISFAFVVERGRITGSVIFAIVAGLVVASVLYWSGDFKSWEPWRLVSALLAVSIAAPLFQGWRDGGELRWAIPYVETHNRAWVNVCLWFASWLFIGLVFLLAWLLAALFKLIGITMLEELLGESWFWMMLAGAAFGGAVGMLRDRERIVALLQKVVMIVLSVLAPVLALGLALFLLALPFTGLDTLWESTKATTPILLSCVIGALILANAIIRDRAEDESTQPLLKASALVLAVAVLPLGIIAVISTNLRIEQYGYTPDRLWALTFTLIAVAYGLGYILSLRHGPRADWAERIRAMNMRLALGLCALAFVLSTPLISFGAISARDQLARLESGKVKPEQFDYAAMRFDYGPAGVEALKHLAKEGKTPKIREFASAATNSHNRYDTRQTITQAQMLDRIIVFPKGSTLPKDLKEGLKRYSLCTLPEKPCNVIFRQGSDHAMVIHQTHVTHLRLKGGKWEYSYPYNRDSDISHASEVEINRAFTGGTVEIREVRLNQIFVDDKPVGAAFD